MSRTIKTAETMHILITQSKKNTLNIILSLLFILSGTAISVGQNLVYKEAAELINAPLRDFICKNLEPLAKLNHYDKNKDLILVDQYYSNSDSCSNLIAIMIIDDDSVADWVESEKDQYVIDIKTLRLFYTIENGDINIIKPLNGLRYIGKTKKDRLLIMNDDIVIWYFKISDDYFRCIYEEDFGCSWLRDPESRKYIPALPYRIMPEELRDMPFIRVETTERPQRSAISY